MASTYVPIATQTLGSASNSVTFNSLGNYTDIVAIIAIPSSGINTPCVRFNGDSGSNYSTTVLTGTTGSGAASYRESNKSYGILGGLVSGLGANSNIIAHFQNYGNSTTYKTVLTRANSAANEVDADVILWRSTAAITSISFIDYAGGANTYPVGTTFTLYGIKAA